MRKTIFDFTNENYVVTGSSSGIGRQVTLELANAGATILAIGRNQERLAAVKAECPEKIITHSLDVCDSKMLQSAIAEFVKEYGKLSGGVHCAGIFDFTPLRLYSISVAEQIMKTNVFAGIELLRLITKKKYGKDSTSTVMLSSVSAYHSPKGALWYSASKSALDSAVRTCAKEISDTNHRCNSVVIGRVDSLMTNQTEEYDALDTLKNRFLLGIGNITDVTGMVLFLLSERADWITGSNIAVDGGFLA